MNTCIFHSVNAGLYLWDGMSGLLIDGIHDGREQGFSVMPTFLEQQLVHRSGLFAHVDGVLFTHLHGDHFQRAGLMRMLSYPCPPAVYGPTLPESNASVRQIRNGLVRVQMAGAYILAKDTVHDAECYRNDPHQSFLIRICGESIFIAGDAILSEADTVDFSSFHGSKIDAAFCNLYQLLSPEGQAFFRRLAPERLFLYHRPFREDDVYRQNGLARQVLRKLPDDFPPVEVLPHMAWVDGRQAAWDFSPDTAKPHSSEKII